MAEHYNSCDFVDGHGLTVAAFIVAGLMGGLQLQCLGRAVHVYTQV